MPVAGGAGPFSNRTLWANRAYCPCPQRFNGATADQANDDLPAGYAQLASNAGTVVTYIGGGQYAITKNGGTGGSFDSDAISTASIAGDVEAVIDWGSGSLMAGLNTSSPTGNSTYNAGDANAFLWWDSAGSLVWVIAFGGFIGSSHTWQPYGKVVFDSTADAVKFYTSPDRVAWTLIASGP